MDGLRSCVGVSSAIARESWAWCPSLAQADPTYILPVLVGMASLACVEMAFGGRALISKAMALQSPEEVKRVGGFDTRRIVTNLISMAARGISIVFIPIAIEAPAVRFCCSPPATCVSLTWRPGRRHLLAVQLHYDATAEYLLLPPRSEQGGAHHRLAFHTQTGQPTHQAHSIQSSSINKVYPT